MPARKGRPQRERNGERALYAQVDTDVIERLNAGAIALNVSRAAYIELLVRGMPVDDRGLPLWLVESGIAGQSSEDEREGRAAA